MIISQIFELNEAVEAEFQWEPVLSGMRCKRSARKFSVKTAASAKQLGQHRRPVSLINLLLLEAGLDKEESSSTYS